jgi:ABC-type phosphate/phosphonate transport system permease subunit
MIETFFVVFSATLVANAVVFTLCFMLDEGDDDK